MGFYYLIFIFQAYTHCVYMCKMLVNIVYLAHSANVPEGQYILLVSIFFLFFFIFTARGYAKRGICRRRVTVCLSVCHTPVLYQNG